jgi:hypothetical protein
MTFSITTLSIMTLSIMTQHNRLICGTQHSSFYCHYAKFRVFVLFFLSVIVLSVVMLNVVVMSVVAPGNPSLKMMVRLS